TTSDESRCPEASLTPLRPLSPLSHTRPLYAAIIKSIRIEQALRTQQIKEKIAPFPQTNSPKMLE
ncbi:MAG: hypothetical protein KME55_40500, partial [Nostoc indistinguendum CM1-VF10]|nr:hypothetical protein [Nostoc indistinguendum CM1-VF10]